MRVAFVTSEIAPWSKTGGLGDVGGALPAALLHQPGVQVFVFTPLYRDARTKLEKQGRSLQAVGASFPLGGGKGQWKLLRGPQDPPTFFLDAPHLFEREGIYGPPGTSAYGPEGYPDNLQRFKLFNEAVVDHAESVLNGPVDVYHCHDWQAGLIPGMLYRREQQTGSRPATVYTVHNLAYQGAFHLKDLDGEEPLHGYVHHGHLNIMAGAIVVADRVTTVSPGYAAEITTEAFGCGLQGLLGWRGVTGIINGIDPKEWNPSTDPHLPARYSREDLSGKAVCRRALLAEFGLSDEPGEILLGMVARLAHQKGPDLVAELVPRLAGLRAKLIIVGTGEPRYEEQLRALAAQNHNRVGLKIVFDEGLAHRITAGADALLIPSRFEPCGLVQMYAMTYGTLPIASAVGGLRDTVTDPGDEALARGEGTGFLFHEVSVDGLAQAVERASRMRRERPDAWARVQQVGMGSDWSWDASAHAWAGLYRAVLQAMSPGEPRDPGGEAEQPEEDLGPEMPGLSPDQPEQQPEQQPDEIPQEDPQHEPDVVPTRTPEEVPDEDHPAEVPGSPPEVPDQDYPAEVPTQTPDEQPLPHGPGITSQEIDEDEPTEQMGPSMPGQLPALR